MKNVEIIKGETGNLVLIVDGKRIDAMSEAQVIQVLQTQFGFKHEQFQIIKGKEYAEEYYEKCSQYDYDYRYLCTGVHGTVNWNQALAEAYAYPVYQDLIELRYQSHVAFKIAIGETYLYRIVNPSETDEIVKVLDKRVR